MSYKITIANEGNHIHNPLLSLAGCEYATREEACEAIYAALYDVIDGESGCEMVQRPALDGANFYIAKVKTYAGGHDGEGWITTSRAGGVWLYNDREAYDDWCRVDYNCDDCTPMTYSDAIKKIAELESEHPYRLGNDEIGSPTYYIIDDRTHDWLCADASCKYVFDDDTDDMSDDELGAWMLEQDEEYVEDCSHHICNGSDANAADDEANARWRDWYDNKCRAYILGHGYATEDGVSATVEEKTNA